jgi:hypothetical protein
VSDIFREVDEEVRKEQFEKLWKRYGVYVIALAVAIVVAVAGYEGWKAWQTEQRREAAEQYAAAWQLAVDGKTDDAVVAMAELADPASEGYGLLAAFEEARLLAAQGKTDEAVARWQAIAGGDAPAALTHVAVLLAVQHRLDGGDPTELTTALQPLVASDAPYRPLALEMLALVALKQGDIAAAREHLQQVADDLVAPAGARTRATQLLATIGE